jgi:hypothetical protein
VEDPAQPLSISAASLSNLAIDPAHPDTCTSLSYGGTALGLATVYGAELPAVWFQLLSDCDQNASCTRLPTASPTATPTSVPTTAQPTAVPSAHPTTASPTPAPTAVPTTAHPTRAPTRAPTAAPRFCYGQCGAFTVINMPNGSVCYCDAFCLRYVVTFHPITFVATGREPVGTPVTRVNTLLLFSLSAPPWLAAALELPTPAKTRTTRHTLLCRPSTFLCHGVAYVTLQISFTRAATLNSHASVEIPSSFCVRVCVGTTCAARTLCTRACQPPRPLPQLEQQRPRPRRPRPQRELSQH